MGIVFLLLSYDICFLKIHFMNTIKKENNEYKIYKAVALHKGYDAHHREKQSNDMANETDDQGAFP